MVTGDRDILCWWWFIRVSWN